MALRFTLAIYFCGLFFSSDVLAQQTASLNDQTIYVRFKPGTEVVTINGNILINNQPGNESNDLGYWRKTYSMNPAKLDSLRFVAEKNLNKRIPDLNLDYRFVLDHVSDVEQALEKLNAHPSVFSAKKAPKLIPATAPDYMPLQGYLFNNSIGINAEAVWTTYNNHGEGIKICDVEYTFNENHLDLPQVTVVGVTPEDPWQGTGGDHGTAVLGEMGSLNDGIGTTGIAYGSDFYFSGCYYGGMYELENALLETTEHLNPGDVVLIEQQIDGPNFSGQGQFGYVPVEWYQEFYDAIQVIVGQGIIVVEAAGNGQQNLDDEIYITDNWGHYPFYPGNESGAIIIGAGAVNSDTPRSVAWFSNYGSVVSVQGNGEAIYTTGYGDLFSDTEDEYYTSDFGGTSGASPIVTSAVALLNSVYNDQTGLQLTRNQIVDIFTLTGQPQQDGDLSVAEAHIGPLPNIKAAIDYALTSLNVQENEAQLISVYPNPNNGVFHLSYALPIEQLELYLHDLSGKEIPFQVKSLTNSVSSISTNDLPVGVYTLTAVSTNKTEVLKLVIQ